MIGSICCIHISNKAELSISNTNYNQIAEEDLWVEMFNLIIICVADVQLSPITIYKCMYEVV